MHQHLRRLLITTGILSLGFLPAGLGIAAPALQAGSGAHPAVVGPHLNQPDTVCRDCHQEIYDRYEQTPMAQGSGLAINGLDGSEIAAKNLTHVDSGITYSITIQKNQPYLDYRRPATPQKPVLNGRFRLDYFIGSGRRGRTYLYNVDGLWFEIPINWYAKTQMWDMAPAYGNARAMPDPLPVDSNCLHCHAGDVQPAIGPARNRYAAQPFQSAGVGCSACHGDPSQHLRLVSTTYKRTGKVPAQLKSAHQPVEEAVGIINPSKLDPNRRDSICLQCHLEGDAAVYLPGKSLQAFKPGEDLSRSVTYFIDSTRAQLGSRASSQYEALLRSACKRAVGDRLTCTTCHDPHSSPRPPDRVAYFRKQCLGCHTSTIMAKDHHPEQQDCAACHMPTRKTSDISHEQLTDHDIEVPSLPQTPLPAAAPLGTANLGAANLVPVGNSPASNRELGLAYAQLAERGDLTSGPKALALLLQAERSGAKDPEVLDQLGFLLQVSGSTLAGAERYRSALLQSPLDIIAQSNLAVIDASTGQTQEAIRILSQSVTNDPSRTTAGLNLAFLQCSTGHTHEALGTVQLLLRYNPDSISLHRFMTTGIYGNQQCTMQ